MSLFESASLVVTPNGTKASKLYAIKPTDGSGDLTVTRATSATRVNASGVIETVAANVPRLDYSNGTCPSILVEPQRTNLILNSATVATQSISVTAQSYTLSFYGSGTVTLSGTHTASVVGLGTTRKTYTFTPTAGTLTLTITGTCTKGQLEAGSYATSYIPTTTASVTRNADVISKTGISSLIGQTEGTVFLDFYKNTSSLIFGDGFIELCDDLTSTNNRILFAKYPDSSDLFFQIKHNGSNINSALFTGTNNAQNKVAISYQSGSITIYANGSLIEQINTSFTFSDVLDSINLGNYQGSNIGEKRINSVALWKTRLNNSELATLTTI